jgi:hypothetical protein
MALKSFETSPDAFHIPSPSFWPNLPGGVATAHDADDLPADLFFDNRPPRHEAEAEPVIDHGETPADELSRADEFASYGLAILNCFEGETSFRGELPPDSLDLLAFECRQEVTSCPQASLRSAPGVAPPDKFVLAPFQGVSNLGTKASIGKCASVAVDQLPVEPSRAVARHLAVEIVRREDAQTCPATLPAS